ncbi:hypothetical protein COCOBI_10-0460 [Coccomyxa sp. Obi]|nr:hypothetical protein COCOBI_10-0460 [Coccomyxa sp. Obi]
MHLVDEGARRVLTGKNLTVNRMDVTEMHGAICRSTAHRRECLDRLSYKSEFHVESTLSAITSVFRGVVHGGIRDGQFEQQEAACKNLNNCRSLFKRQVTILHYYYYYRSANPKPNGHRAYTQRVCSHTVGPLI